jgi:recombinational DNA repair protein (RecF pathway)
MATMQTKVEGLLLSKIPHQERHLIGHALLRSGKKIPVLFYGGRGGGEKMKGTTLELGTMLRIELVRTRSTVEMAKAREWQPIWAPGQVRYNFRAFAFLCFILEVAEKMALPGELHDDNASHDQDSEGIFRVISNAVHRTDSLAKQDSVSWESELILFLCKLLIEVGVAPDLSACTHCANAFSPNEPIQLSPAHGGFSCYGCLNPEERQGVDQTSSGRELLNCFSLSAQGRYAEVSFAQKPGKSAANALVHYFLYQFNFTREKFLSLKQVL